jgi:hypothetical protein
MIWFVSDYRWQAWLRFSKHRSGAFKLISTSTENSCLTFLYASLPYFISRRLVLRVSATRETRHCAMWAVQLLDFLGLVRMQHKNSRSSMAAASQRHWGTPPRNAVLPTATNLTFRPASHATLLVTHRFETFLHLLTTVGAQKSLEDAHSALPCHLRGPATVLSAPSGSETAAGEGNEMQHKLHRWPWSMMGKEVSAQDSPFTTCWFLTRGSECPVRQTQTVAGC